MKIQRFLALILLPAAALLTSCGTRPTAVSAPMPPAAAQNNRTAQNMVYPTNPNRPANVPALGIPVGAHHGSPGRPPGQ